MTNNDVFQWNGIIFRRLAGPKAPNASQKESLSHKLSSSRCDNFSNETMVFGNQEGIDILKILDHHTKLLEDHSKDLKLLQPFKEQMTLRLVLEKSSGVGTIENVRLERNTLAHGGQIITDIEIIRGELDIHCKEVWCQGFDNLYGLSFNKYATDICHDHLIVEIANAYADASTLHDCENENVVTKGGELIDLWCTWADDRTKMYPFRDPANVDMLNDFLSSL